MKGKREDSEISITISDISQIRYTSGLTVYEEKFTEGKLVGRYWSATGCLRTNQEIPTFPKNLPAQVFNLNVYGQSLDYGWDFVTAQKVNEKERKHGIIELTHRLRPIGLKVHTALDGGPFFIRWLEITNKGKRPAALSSVSVWSGVLASGGEVFNQPDYRKTPFSLGRYAGNNWAQEGRFIWEPLVNGVVTHLQPFGPYGTSGYQCPFFIIQNETTSEFFVCYLGWSGTWEAEILCDTTHFQILHFSVGPSAPTPMRVIEPGETVQTPKVHLGYMQSGFDECIQFAHQHIRESVVPQRPRLSRPIVAYNHWGYIAVEKMSEERLLEGIEIASKVGSEAFILDAGWYGKGPGNLRSDSFYTRFMGDWVAGEWLPNDLGPIVERVHQKKMLFGLWIEPEGIGKMSEIYKQHPDWVVSVHGKEFPAVAERLNLDYTKPEVVTWVESELIRLIKRYKLDILRIDGAPMSVQVGEREIGGYLESTIWRHYEILYGILDRIRLKFPKLVIENCCGGGGRNDLGILSRTHWTQLTDEFAIPRLVQIVNGMSIMLPPELGMIFVMKPEQNDLDFILRIALFGRWALSGISPDFEKINPEVLKKIKCYVNLYQSFIAPILPKCKVFHHTPVIELNSEPKTDYCVLEYVSKDTSCGFAGIFKLTDVQESYHFYSRGIKEEKRYKVTFGNKGYTVEMKGLELIRKGIKIMLERALTSELIIFKAVSQ